jgi:phosphoglycerate dehydrogenase-like enzyme
MSVVGFDPFLPAEQAARAGVEAVGSLEQLLPRCDFLTVHTPLTEETKSLIGATELALMKPTARVLNVARGGIIDETALAEALQAKTIAGAGLDVFSAEPPPADLPLLKAPNVVLTPHRDAPGLIGHIGTIFGKHQVNIAQMTVGRQAPGGEAIAVLNLDSAPPEEALTEVRAHPFISSLCVVKLPPAGALPPWFG